MRGPRARTGHSDPGQRQTVDPSASLQAEEVKRIAVIRALHLGDLLLAVPALRAIRAGFPNAEISLISLPWAEWFVRHFQHYVDRFVEFGGYPGINEVELAPERAERFLREQRAYHYDLVVQMHGSGTVSLPLALDLHGRMTAGYYPVTAPEGVALGAPYPDDQPEILRNVGLACLLGCPDRGLHLELPLSIEDRQEAKAILAPLRGKRRPWVGIHPGASAPARRWPPEFFAAVADWCVRTLGARVILTGGPGEESIVDRVTARMKSCPLNVAGQTSLGGLAALIAKLDLYISNDTGPAHLATAVDTRSITIFGPEDHRRWAPLDRSRHPIVRRPVPCSPCTYTVCPIDHRCLRRLPPDVVIEVAAGLLAPGEVACGA